jgi:hypothetical protein
VITPGDQALIKHWLRAVSLTRRARDASLVHTGDKSVVGSLGDRGRGLLAPNGSTDNRLNFFLRDPHRLPTPVQTVGST